MPLLGSLKHSAYPIIITVIIVVIFKKIAILLVYQNMSQQLLVVHINSKFKVTNFWWKKTCSLGREPWLMLHSKGRGVLSQTYPIMELWSLITVKMSSSWVKIKLEGFLQEPEVYRVLKVSGYNQAAINSQVQKKDVFILLEKLLLELLDNYSMVSIYHQDVIEIC